MKRIFAVFLSLSLLLLSACSSEAFSYITSDITEYYDLALSEITGKTYSADLPERITEEDARRKLHYLQMYHATVKNKDAYEGSPAFADQAFIYFDVGLSPEGDGVVSNFFSEDGAYGAVIGIWEFPDEKLEQFNPLLDNKAVSDALTETLPVPRVKEGTVEAGDVVVLDFDRLDAPNNQHLSNFLLSLPV